jgi:hypothetical protein
MEKKAICLIGYTPNEIWLHFLNKIDKNCGYDIFFLIDVDYVDYNAMYGAKYPNVKIVIISHAETEENYYINSSSRLGFPKIIAWDKALYYFCKLNCVYDYVWFFEDDAFFYNIDVISNIDKKYPNSDLLTKDYEINENGEHNYWFWYGIDFFIPPPYYNAMICVSRLSKKMLQKIDEYVAESKTLLFIEAMIPTLAKHHQLLYEHPDEINETLQWRYDWNITNMERDKVYHPIKNMDKHISIRNEMATLNDF